MCGYAYTKLTLESLCEFVMLLMACLIKCSHKVSFFFARNTQTIGRAKMMRKFRQISKTDPDKKWFCKIFTQSTVHTYHFFLRQYNSITISGKVSCSQHFICHKIAHNISLGYLHKRFNCLNTANKRQWQNKRKLGVKFNTSMIINFKPQYCLSESSETICNDLVA